jgi:Lrp/AsnC family leucine-responsive transcriptional regulator
MTGRETGPDATDWGILAELRRDARKTYTEIGEAVGLTRPAVRERILRMEEAGIIAGYRVALDVDALGTAVHAMVAFKFDADRDYGGRPNDALIRFLDSRRAVVRYWELYGDLDFLVEAAFRTKEELHRFLDELRAYGFVRPHLIASARAGSYPEGAGRREPPDRPARS